MVNSNNSYRRHIINSFLNTPAVIPVNSTRQSLSRNIPTFSIERHQTSVEKKHNFKAAPTPVRSGRKSGMAGTSTVVMQTPSNNLGPKEPPVRFTTIRQLSADENRVQITTPSKMQEKLMPEGAPHPKDSASARKQ
jgi:hypothetical protein